MSAPPNDAVSVRDENRPWLKGAWSFYLQTIQPAASALETDAAYTAPDKNADAKGRAIGCGVPILGVVLIIISFTAFDGITDAGVQMFGFGVILLIAGPVIGMLLAGAVAHAGDKPPETLALEKALIQKIAGFIGYGFAPGSDIGENADRERLQGLLIETSMFRPNRPTKKSMKTEADFLKPTPVTAHDHRLFDRFNPGWSDRFQIKTGGGEAFVWDLRWRTFRGVALLCPSPRATADDRVVAIGLRQGVPDNIYPRPKPPAPLAPVTLEPNAFTKRHKVFAADEIRARRLLTPAVMARLTTASDRFRSKGSAFAFWDGWFVAAIEVDGDPFDVDPRRAAYEENALLDVFDQFAALRDVIEELRLDSTSRL